MKFLNNGYNYFTDEFVAIILKLFKVTSTLIFMSPSACKYFPWILFWLKKYLHEFIKILDLFSFDDFNKEKQLLVCDTVKMYQLRHTIPKNLPIVEV